MKILIVNNCTNFLDNIISLISKAYDNPTIQVINYFNLYGNFETAEFNLIILSGGKPKRHIELSEKDRKIYLNYEKELILNTKVPIIGICYGFKLICETFTANITYEPSIIKGPITINLKDKLKKLLNTTKATVIVQHHFITTQVGQSLEVLATSKYGIEAVKHTQRPIYGFQFHPELDINNQQGDEIMNKIINAFNVINP